MQCERSVERMVQYGRWSGSDVRGPRSVRSLRALSGPVRAPHTGAALIIATHLSCPAVWLLQRGRQCEPP